MAWMFDREMVRWIDIQINIYVDGQIDGCIARYNYRY